jgi:hypothetical protein
VQQVPIEAWDFRRLKHILEETKSLVQRPDCFLILHSYWCLVAQKVSSRKVGVNLRELDNRR